MVLITPKNAYFEELKSSGTPINTILKSESLILREEGSGSRKFVYELLENLHIPENSLNVTARLNDQESIKISLLTVWGFLSYQKRPPAAPDRIRNFLFLIFRWLQTAAACILFTIRILS